MSRYIAFLRAINVGGRVVKMVELKKLFEVLGFSNVETFIASGNVIFESKLKDTKTLEKKIEAHLHQSLGYEVVTFIRTDSEISKIAAYKSFKESALKSAGALNVVFLKEGLDAEAKKLLTTLKSDINDFHTHNSEVYWLCKKKQSESKFSNVVFEKKLSLRATFRGINTISRLASIL